MKISRIAVPSVLIAFVLGGCASGNAVLQDGDMTSLSHQIVSEKATEAQVKEILKGDPSDTCQDKDGNDIWIYSAKKESTNLMEYIKAEKDVHRKTLRITFDKDKRAVKAVPETHTDSSVSMLGGSVANPCQ